MNDSLSDEMVRLYPNIFKQYHMTEEQRHEQGYYNSFDAFGFETPHGWDNMLRALCKTLDNILTADGGDVNVVQVKEKFGGLRFYYEGDAPVRFRAAVDSAEALSYSVCDVCGGEGKLRNDHGWLYVACEEHSKPKEKA